MARPATSFVCQNCGGTYGRWQGKCDACGEWNTIAEESSAAAPAAARGRRRKGRLFALEPLTGAAETAIVAGGFRSGWVSSVGVCLVRCFEEHAT